MFKFQNIKLGIILLGSLLVILATANLTPSLITKVSAEAPASQDPSGAVTTFDLQQSNYQSDCLGNPSSGKDKKGKPNSYDGKVDKNNCGIVRYLIKFIDALSAIVGIVIVIMIAIAGIQYSAARDNPQAVVAARAKIFNAILALVVFIFSFAFLQYIVPGGIFKP